jgi:hypothetical protein
MSLLNKLLTCSLKSKKHTLFSINILRNNDMKINLRFYSDDNEVEDEPKTKGF